MISVRAATTDDVEICAAMVADVQQATWSRFAGPAFEPHRASDLVPGWSRAVCDPQHVALVAEVDGQVAGVWRAFPEDQSVHPSVTDGTSAHVADAYVCELFHGAGVAQRLMEEGLLVLTGAGFDSVRLWVPVRNARARAFYRRSGFRDTGKERQWAGVRRCEMRRRLQDVLPVDG
jgi:ribosomal protein S18 acetylase RimI-like enzyme